jgi:flagellar biosynthesis protein FlhG
MTDQAYRLRRLAELAGRPTLALASGSDGSAAERHPETDLAAVHVDAGNAGLRRTRVLAVTSGKGGVGKTNIVTNLAIALSQAGMRVIVVDADLGLANIDVLLGLHPKYNLGHVVSGQRSLEETITDGPAGIRIIPGASGLRDLAQMEVGRRHALLTDLVALDGQSDLLLIDTGAGISSSVIDFVVSADEVIVVTTPEPTAIADAYAMVKVISQTSPDTYIRLLVNQVRSEQEAAQVAEQISSIARRFLNVYVEKLGYVLVDVAVQRSVRAQKPFVLLYPHSAASECIRALAQRFITGRSMCVAPGGVAGFVKRILTAVGRRYDGS